MNSQEEQKDQTVGALSGATSPCLKFMMTIEALPFYADRILKTASAVDDFCYLVTPYSLILVRIEANRVTEIMTSSLGIVIREKFKQD